MASSSSASSSSWPCTLASVAVINLLFMALHSGISGCDLLLIALHLNICGHNLLLMVLHPNICALLLFL
jgi:hypothetical protein